MIAVVDYIGLDAFPDVFHPIPHDRLAGAVAFLLERFRTVTTGTSRFGLLRDDSTPKPAYFAVRELIATYG